MPISFVGYFYQLVDIHKIFHDETDKLDLIVVGTNV